MTKSKNVEISLPFSGEGTKMAHLEFRGENAKIGKNHYFSKITPSRSICKWYVAKNLLQGSFEIFLRVLKILNDKI